MFLEGYSRRIFGLFLQDAALSFSVFNGSRCAHHLEYFCCGFIFPRSSKGLFRIDIFLVEIWEKNRITSIVVVSLHCSLWLVLEKFTWPLQPIEVQNKQTRKKSIVCLVFTSCSNWFLVLFSSVPFGLCDYSGLGWTLQATDSRRRVRVLWRTVRVSLLKLAHIFNRASAVHLLFSQ